MDLLVGCGPFDFDLRLYQAPSDVNSQRLLSPDSILGPGSSNLRDENSATFPQLEVAILKMCKAYYAVFPCGHAVKLRLSNCYPNFTCKHPKRENIDAPVAMKCQQCGKIPASELDQLKVRQKSAAKLQNLTPLSAGSEPAHEVLSDAPPKSGSAAAAVEMDDHIASSSTTTNAAELTKSIETMSL